jgi:hypothetical protein
MPARFEILPDLALVVVRYEGHATIQEGFDAFEAYMTHPDRNPQHRHLVDLGGISGFDADFAGLFRLQAHKASGLTMTEPSVMIVYHTPTMVSQRLAQQVLRSWEGLPGAIIRIAQDWDGAMDILGLRRDAVAPPIYRDA